MHNGELDMAEPHEVNIYLVILKRHHTYRSEEVPIGVAFADTPEQATTQMGSLFQKYQLDGLDTPLKVSGDRSLNLIYFGSLVLYTPTPHLLEIPT
jgi:hypothetical protein